MEFRIVLEESSVGGPPPVSPFPPAESGGAPGFAPSREPTVSLADLQKLFADFNVPGPVAAGSPGQRLDPGNQADLRSLRESFGTDVFGDESAEGAEQGAAQTHQLFSELQSDIRTLFEAFHTALGDIPGSKEESGRLAEAMDQLREAIQEESANRAEQWLAAMQAGAAPPLAPPPREGRTAADFGEPILGAADASIPPASAEPEKSPIPPAPDPNSPYEIAQRRLREVEDRHRAEQEAARQEEEARKREEEVQLALAELQGAPPPRPGFMRQTPEAPGAAPETQEEPPEFDRLAAMRRQAETQGRPGLDRKVMEEEDTRDAEYWRKWSLENLGREKPETRSPYNPADYDTENPLGVEQTPGVVNEATRQAEEAFEPPAYDYDLAIPDASKEDHSYEIAQRELAEEERQQDLRRQQAEKRKAIDAAKEEMVPTLEEDAPGISPDQLAAALGKAGMGKAGNMVGQLGKLGDAPEAMSGIMEGGLTGETMMAAAGPIGAAVALAKLAIDGWTDDIKSVRKGFEGFGDQLTLLASNSHMGMFVHMVDAGAGALEKIPLVGKLFAEGLQTATAPVRIFGDVVDAFVARGKQLSMYQGDLAGATAQADVGRLLADINEANELGPGLGMLTDGLSRFETEFREMMLPVKKVIVEALATVMSDLADFMQWVRPMLAAMLEAIKGLIAVVGAPFDAIAKGREALDKIRKIMEDAAAKADHPDVSLGDWLKAIGDVGPAAALPGGAGGGGLGIPLMGGF